MKSILLLTFAFVSCGFTPPEDDGAEAERAGISAQSRQCILGPGSLRSGGSGVFSIGTPADRILAQCLSATDTVATDAEGDPQRVIVVKDSVGEIRIEIVEGRAWRLRVTTPRPTTTEGIGVGDPLTKLLALPDIEVLTGEGQLFVKSSGHCGLSFRLDYVPDPASGAWSRTELERLPSSTRIEEVLVFECSDA